MFANALTIARLRSDKVALRAIMENVKIKNRKIVIKAEGWRLFRKMRKKVCALCANKDLVLDYKNADQLEELEKIYGVSYPTIRNRLDQLIQKIKVSGEKEDNSYVRLIQRLAIEDKIEFSAANLLIRKYREEKNQ